MSIVSQDSINILNYLARVSWGGGGGGGVGETDKVKTTRRYIKRTLGCLWYVLHKKRKALNWVVLNCSVPVIFFKWGIIKTI